MSGALTRTGPKRSFNTMSVFFRELCRPRVAVVLMLAGSGAIGLAQDVSVSPVQWSDPRDPPDVLPVLKSALRTRFPDELRTTPDIGYVVYEMIIDAKGRSLMQSPHPTLNTLLTAENMAAQNWVFSPGRRDGKAVNTAFTFAVIFNPASAGLKKTDATPRLLDASMIKVPRPKGAKSTEYFPDVVAPAEVMVDREGMVTDVTDAPGEFRDPIAIAMKNWRFAPAREGGQPVAAKIRVPVILTRGGEPTGKMTQPARVTFQAPPVYPFGMRASGMRGEVVVDFFVDIEGRVRNAHVARSLNPAFDDPAIEAVRKWRFEPARAGDRPVASHMQVPIVFALDDTFAGGSDGMEVKRKGDLSKLPEALRYDTPPKLRGSVRPVFPYAALSAKREGKAVVSYLVDEAGRVIDAKVIEASSPEFGGSLLAAIAHFEFQPALKGGRPNKALQGFIQEFKRGELQGLVSDDDLSLLRREEKQPGSIFKLSDLDSKLKALSQRPPVFPLSLLGKVAQGEALVEILIDEDGRVRLPRVVSASHEPFGYAALQGVAAWRFEAPTRGGRAAVVRVQVPIHFTSPVEK